MRRFDITATLRIGCKAFGRKGACLVLSLIWLTSAPVTAAPVDEEFDLDIPPGKANVTTKSLSRQTGYSVIFQSAEVEDIETNAVAGRYSVRQALDVLFDGTVLSGGLTKSGVITISRVASNDSQGETMKTGKKAGLIALLASVFTGGAGAQDAEDTEKAEQEPQVLEEIVVTGSQIRGAGAAGANVITLDREYIELSGFATTQEILQSVPQNFGGGANEDVTSVGSVGTEDGINKVSPY